MGIEREAGSKDGWGTQAEKVSGVKSRPDEWNGCYEDSLSSPQDEHSLLQDQKGEAIIWSPGRPVSPLRTGEY